MGCVLCEFLKNQPFGLRSKLVHHYSCQKVWLRTGYGGVVFPTFISGQFNVGLEVNPPRAVSVFRSLQPVSRPFFCVLISTSKWLPTFPPALFFPLLLNLCRIAFFCYVFFWCTGNTLIQGHIRIFHSCVQTRIQRVRTFICIARTCFVKSLYTVAAKI